ncbi:hypothetical protein HDU85_007824 [Gaertneriomyces sp. JEL0708]|nr:hypothetical protein HDU85_007824 [Gaertneriomyces sp. JEL0708]
MVSASALLMVMVSTLLVLFVYNWVLLPYMTLLKFRRQGVHGPSFIPLLGQIKECFTWETAGNRMGMLLKYSLTYGRVYAMTLGPFVTLTVNHPGYLADILRVKAHAFEKGTFAHKYLSAVLGPRNLVIEEGDVHAKHRSMITPAFNFVNLKDMVDLMTAETKQHIQHWLKQDGNVMDLNAALSNMTLDAITVCAFGSGFRNIPDYKRILNEGFTRNEQDVMFRVRWLVHLLPVLSELPIVRKPTIDANRARLQAMIDQVIGERKAVRAGDSRQGKQDLLDLLLEAQDANGESFSDEEV